MKKHRQTQHIKPKKTTRKRGKINTDGQYNTTSPEHNTNTELHIIIGHDRTHLSIDALDQDSMTSHVTTFTYSRSFQALKA